RRGRFPILPLEDGRDYDVQLHTQLGSYLGPRFGASKKPATGRMDLLLLENHAVLRYRYIQYKRVGGRQGDKASHILNTCQQLEVGCEIQSSGKAVRH